MPIKFDHAVKYNGRFYNAGVPIEEPAQKAVEDSQSAEDAKAVEDSAAKAKPAQKAVRGRKKGDA